MKTVTLWIREDGGRPRAIESGSTPPGHGKVFEVWAKSAIDARRIYQDAVAPEPDQGDDPFVWAVWSNANKKCKQVTKNG